MIINLKSQTNLSGFYIVYEGSTNLEKKGWYGISHLLEHLFLKAVDHLQDDFSNDGITFNAYTDTNEVVAYITGLDENVNKWKYILLDLLSKFTITKEQFQNELKIVMEEYMDSFNGQSEIHYLNLHRKIFNSYSPIGLREDLNNLKFIDIINFWELQYSKPSKIINVSKYNDFKKDDINFAKRDINKEYLISKYESPLELGNSFGDKSSIILISPGINEKNAYIEYINNMLSNGLTSPLYQLIREEHGLVYFLHLFQWRMNKTGFNHISTLTSNENVDKFLELTKQVYDNPDKYLTKERFNLIKNNLKIINEKRDILRYNNIEDYLNPSGWNVSEILNTVTYDEIRDIYDTYYKFDELYISIDKKEFK